MDPGLVELAERGSPDDEVAVILRLDDPAAVPAGIRVVARFGRIFTCRLRRGDVASARTAENVASMKSARAVLPEPDPSVVPGWAEPPLETIPLVDERRPPSVSQTGRGVCVGLIDWGIDFAHPDFRHADGSTRLLALWDQRPGPQATRPNRYGYGVIHTAEDINRALAATDPYAALGYYPADSDTGIGCHGTHTASIAAGSGRVAPSGVAPEADLVFVELSTWGVQGPTALGDSVALLEGVDFIARTADTRPWCLNMSLGQHAGPHDGCSLVEQALDAILVEAPGRAAIMSCGNYYERPIHATGRLRPGEQRTLVVEALTGGPIPHELDVWYSGRDRFMVEVRAPHLASRGRAAPGERLALSHAGRDYAHAYHRLAEPNNSDNHINLVLYPDAPPGQWEIDLIAQDVVDGRWHAWCERESACRTCQLIFRREDAVPTSTIGSICNGFRTIAVGAYNAHSAQRELGPFSSSGQTRDGRQKPDVVAPGVFVLGARSAANPPREDAPMVTRMNGTSMAAPHVTGSVALMFEAAPRPLHIHETRSLLLASAEHVDAAPEVEARLGSGYLDIEAAVTAAANVASDTGTSPVTAEEDHTMHPVEPTIASADDEAELYDLDEEDAVSERLGTLEFEPGWVAASIPATSRSEAALGAAEFSRGNSSGWAEYPADANQDLPGTLPDSDDGLPDTLSDGFDDSEIAPPLYTWSAREEPLQGAGARMVELADVLVAQNPMHTSALALVGEVLSQAGVSSGLSPHGPTQQPRASEIFNAFVRPSHAGPRRHFEQVFEVVALPRQVLGGGLRPGDLLVREAGGLGHAAIVASAERHGHTRLYSRGLTPEGTAPGEYVHVVEGGARPHRAQDNFARRVTDSAGRLPMDTLVLRPRTDVPLLNPGWTESPPPAPPPRLCCILAATIRPFSADSNLADPANLGMHSSSEVTGLIYTGKAGFVDLGHLRDLCDMTKYVYDQIVAASGSPSSVSTWHGFATFSSSLPHNTWLPTASAICCDDSFAYEIVTYTHMSAGGHNSSFSPEDMCSNFLGTVVAAQAIAAGGSFNAAVTTALNGLLTSLDAQSKAESLNAFNLINHRWVEFAGVSSLLSDAYLRRRNFTRTPWHAGHPSDRATPAWVTARLSPVAPYAYTNTLDRSIPASTFALEVAHIQADARTRYGPDFARP